MNAAEIGPVPAEQRRQSSFDLFLIFAGANIVATTLLTGAALVPAFAVLPAFALILLGTLIGSALVATLAVAGPRYGVPSVIAARAAFGRQGATLIALLLFLGNFAWIALNNVIAASACARLTGGGEDAWSLGLGMAATMVVALGPRVVGLADRVAVPVMITIGVLLAVRFLDVPAAALATGGTGELSWARGLDVVVGYQVSWILMFADYSRYTSSASGSALAVFLGLALTSLWFMPLGTLAALLAGSRDPADMLAAAGLGGAGAVLLALATLTTNFVNIYLSALALRSVVPAVPPHLSVWAIGVVGSLLGLLSRTWLDRYGDFMLVLGGLLVPVGGVLLWRFFLSGEPVEIEELYAEAGRYRGVRARELLAWAAGVTAFYLAAPIGGTLPALAVSVAAAFVLSGRRAAAATRSR